MIEQCPQLIAKIQERNSGPTQNIQLISVEQRPAPTINVVTQSGATTHRQDTETQLAEAWVRKALEKVPTFASEREQETVMVTKHDFVDPTIAVAPTQQHQ